MSTSGLSHEALDAAACKAVGIEPKCWIVTSTHDAQGREREHPLEEHYSTEREFAKPEWYAVSQEPAACAMMKAAAIKSGLTIVIELSPVEDADAWVSEDPIDSPGFSARAKTEERAVALAVVAWAAQAEEREDPDGFRVSDTDGGAA